MVTIESNEQRPPTFHVVEVDNKLEKETKKHNDDATSEEDDEVQFENLYDDDDADAENFVSKGVLKLRQLGYKLISYVSNNSATCSLGAKQPTLWIHIPWFQPYLNVIGRILLLAGFIVYFGFAMKFNNPFSFMNLRSNMSSSELMENYIFSNNKGEKTLCYFISKGSIFKV